MKFNYCFSIEILTKRKEKNIKQYECIALPLAGSVERLRGGAQQYEVCSEKNRNFLISRVWRVLLPIFFIMLVFMPLKYVKIFSCIHCLLCLWQPLRLDVFLWARRFSFVKRNGSKYLYQILCKTWNKV